MPPRLVVIFGLIASGKTTLARHLGRHLGWPTIHSDQVRKALAGIPPTQRVTVPFGEGLYAPEMSGRTYDEMFRQAEEHLQAGRSVILDGSFMRAADRLRARGVAAACGADIFFVLCSCPAEETRRRLRGRHFFCPVLLPRGGDPSPSAAAGGQRRGGLGRPTGYSHGAAEAV